MDNIKRAIRFLIAAKSCEKVLINSILTGEIISACYSIGRLNKRAENLILEIS
jgi:hypothetical protein